MNPRDKRIYETLEKMFPQASCELNYQTALELMIAVMLSAQTTDQAVNKVTSTLFQKYQSFSDYYQADIHELENDIRHLGLYKNKAKNIQAMTKVVHDEYCEVFPKDLTLLTQLPGVGRKTANVFLSEFYHVPSIAVDTHVFRVSYRLGLAKEGADVYKTELSLQKKFPKYRWSSLHHLLIFFGRYFCKAKKPNCKECPFVDICKTPFIE